MKAEFKFIAPLVNVDSSILRVKLGDGFTIEMSDESEFLNLIERLEGGTSVGTDVWLTSSDFLRRQGGRAFIITRPMDISEKDIRTNEKLLNTVDEFRYNHEENHLDKMIELLLLFKEGDLAVPHRYYVKVRGNKIERFMASDELGWNPFGTIYSIGDAELQSLHYYLTTMKLPFESAHLRLALDNMLISYRTSDTELSFLSLMIAMEALFSRSDQELKYSISRNAAVLLGDDGQDSWDLFEEMNDLYRKRFHLVHGMTEGKKPIQVDEGEVLRLRWFVRESIKEIYELNMSRDDLHRMLTSSGFGSKKSRLSRIGMIGKSTQ